MRELSELVSNHLVRDVDTRVLFGTRRDRGGRSVEEGGREEGKGGEVRGEEDETNPLAVVDFEFESGWRGKIEGLVSMVVPYDPIALLKHEKSLRRQEEKGARPHPPSSFLRAHFLLPLC